MYFYNVEIGFDEGTTETILVHTQKFTDDELHDMTSIALHEAAKVEAEVSAERLSDAIVHGLVRVIKENLDPKKIIRMGRAQAEAMRQRMIDGWISSLKTGHEIRVCIVHTDAIKYMVTTFGFAELELAASTYWEGDVSLAHTGPLV